MCISGEWRAVPERRAFVSAHPVSGRRRTRKLLAPDLAEPYKVTHLEEALAGRLNLRLNPRYRLLAVPEVAASHRPRPSPNCVPAAWPLKELHGPVARHR